MSPPPAPAAGAGPDGGGTSDAQFAAGALPAAEKRQTKVFQLHADAMAQPTRVVSAHTSCVNWEVRPDGPGLAKS
jgi:hypothetical protein